MLLMGMAVDVFLTAVHSNIRHCMWAALYWDSSVYTTMMVVSSRLSILLFIGLFACNQDLGL